MRCRTPRAIEGITTMAFISRGFHGRPRRDVDPARVPPGQYVVDDFPVLSAGPTPHSPLDEWSFTIHGAVGEPVSWPWKEFAALPAETFTVDIHCVTKWSKLGTTWTGVSLDSLLDSVQTEAEFVSVWCDGGYTTNLPLEVLTGGRAQRTDRRGPGREGGGGRRTRAGRSRWRLTTAVRRACWCPPCTCGRAP